MNEIIISVIVFLLITLILVVSLLVAKSKLIPSGNVTITINDDKTLETPMGGTLLNTLQNDNIFLSSACGAAAVAANAAAGLFRVVARYCPRKPVSFRTKSKKTIGDWPAKRK